MRTAYHERGMTEQSKPATILIAEDRAVDRGAIKYIFERARRNYVFSEAVDGEETRAKAKAEKPDLIILDLQMPPTGDKEGIRILEDLHADPETASIPVVVLTHLGYECLPGACEELGVKDFFRKWTDLERLVAAVDRLLEGKPRQSEV